ncbi:MAG: hypothetical protein LAO76_21230 [Acidobacteriia bacterium]|nr:hypothetical protein [Terriglobia bacterium]
MNDRVKEVYLMLGNILNNPRAFGLAERPPKALDEALTKMQLNLMHELREEMSEGDFLAMELSQDADREAFPEVTSTSFTLKTGT